MGVGGAYGAYGVGGDHSPERWSRRAFLLSAGGGLAGWLSVGREGWPDTRKASSRGFAGLPLPVAAFDAEVAAAWFDLALDLVGTTPGYSPTVAARAFGYAGVALHEALLPGMPDRPTLAGRLNELAPVPGPSDPFHHWPTVANATLASILRRLFPTAPNSQRDALDRLERQITHGPRATASPFLRRRSERRGRAVADHIFEWSRTDGGHEGYLHNFLNYEVPSGPGHWVPTPPAFQPPLQPSWGRNRPFALSSGEECDPGPPVAYSEDPRSTFSQDALHVYTTSRNLTTEQREVALFWSDDAGRTATPSGHWISILTQVLRRQRWSLDVAARAYAAVGTAVSDAFVACWHTKYRHHLLRPVTYIRRLVDPDWTPLLVTPPFPEFTSGHSVQSTAAAHVLAGQVGERPFTDHTHDARGLPARSFRSFWQAAEEAAVSRLYGGIHFRPAIVAGMRQGECVGRRVSSRLS